MERADAATAFEQQPSICSYQSNLKEILNVRIFPRFPFDYYSADDINPATGHSSLEAIWMPPSQNAIDFIDHFDSTFSNLTSEIPASADLLSNCIAMSC